MIYASAWLQTKSTNSTTAALSGTLAMYIWLPMAVTLNSGTRYCIMMALPYF